MQPVLMLDQVDVAAELNHLQELEHAGVDTDGLLLDLGKVVELRHAIAAAKFGSAVPVRSFSAADMAHMAHLGRRLLCLAIDTVRRSLPPAQNRCMSLPSIGPDWFFAARLWMPGLVSATITQASLHRHDQIWALSDAHMCRSQSTLLACISFLCISSETLAAQSGPSRHGCG